MEIINFIIACSALIIAIFAYRKAGGTLQSMKEQIDEVREVAAGALGKVEESIRPASKNDKTEQKEN